MNKPDKWVVVKLEKKNEETIYKVFGTWLGGYLDGDAWRLNSGIVRVEENNDFYDFYGYSGSCYSCHSKSYGTNYYTQGALDQMIERANAVGDDITVLDKDTNWSTLIKSINNYGH